jgi:hypothetical protein
MQIFLKFHLQQATLPSRQEHLGDLWKVGKLLESFGFPIEDWYPPAATRKKSLASPAFDHHGPTSAALEMLRVRDEKSKTTDFEFRRTGVWSGKEKGRRGAFSTVVSSDVGNPTCLLNLQLNEVEALEDASNMQRFMFGLLDIWPAAFYINVGPLMYYTTHQVFPDRPGVGWMLYLNEVITAAQVPEAAAVVPVMSGDKPKGTIIVSVDDNVFSVHEAEHVKTANAIEVRLADQDLLPRY